MELNLVTYASTALFVISATYLYHMLLTRRSRSTLPLPPSPPGWPVIGHLHLLTDMPHHALAELATTMRAPLLRLRLGSVPAVVISKPDLARAALTTNDAAMASRPHLLSGQFLSFGCSDVTFAPAGPYHRMARRVVVSELEWVMTELLRHPRILNKAQDEVRRVVGGKGRVEESDLAELHYMRAIIKETFRLHPAVPLLVPRESVTACTLGGYHIPTKTRIFINTFAMGRDPEIWKEPLEYSPERFEGAAGEIDLKDPDYKLLPFGGGRRGCPGYTFALATCRCHWPACCTTSSGLCRPACAPRTSVLKRASG